MSRSESTKTARRLRGLVGKYESGMLNPTFVETSFSVVWETDVDTSVDMTRSFVVVDFALFASDPLISRTKPSQKTPTRSRKRLKESGDCFCVVFFFKFVDSVSHHLKVRWFQRSSYIPGKAA